MMQKMGVEPTRYCYHTDLNRARLPIPPLLRTVVRKTFALLTNKTYYSGYGRFCQQYFELFSIIYFSMKTQTILSKFFPFLSFSVYTKCRKPDLSQ